MPWLASRSVSLPRLNTHGVCPTSRQTMGGLSGANKGHTRKSYKLSAGLRTQSVECSKLGKTRIITDASCGMVRNTGFCGQNLPPHVYLELLSIYFS